MNSEAMLPFQTERTLEASHQSKLNNTEGKSTVQTEWTLRQVTSSNWMNTEVKLPIQHEWTLRTSYQNKLNEQKGQVTIQN